MAYFDWHQKPAYYNDVARHFDPERSLLDLGCGLGWMADHVREYVGLDTAPEAVEIAQGKGRDVRLGSLDDPLPFVGESFDAVLLKDVLEHVHDAVSVVREVHRVLRPGGPVLATSPDAQRWVWNDYTHVRPYTRRAFRQLFLDQGFEVLEADYESVMPGIGLVSRYRRDHRRPATLNALARTRLVRRNVRVLARRSSAARP